MFYFLLILGTGLVIYGMIRKNEEVTKGPFAAAAESPGPALGNVMAAEIWEEGEEAVKDLQYRMESLEKTFFAEMLNWQMERETLVMRLTEKEGPSSMEERPVEEPLSLEVERPMKKPMPDHVRSVLELSKEGKTTAEVAKEMKISKGEVLLLRNLAKHYEE